MLIIGNVSENSSRSGCTEIPSSCLFFQIASEQRRGIPHLQDWTVIRNENLKSTTVRFTQSDLHLIESLQEKLGLGMIHVIRLAIRRLAESENLLTFPAAPKKR